VTRRAALAAACGCAFALAAFPGAAPAADAPLSGEAILARVKAKFRAAVRPAFVSYTLSRADGINGRPYLADTGTQRVWCRTVDRAALSRAVHNGVTDGPLTFVRPAFNQSVDPGPPTADIFERNAFASVPVAETPAPADLQTLAVVSVRVETDYRVESVETDAGAYLLRLAPRRDPERNRLRTLWVDRYTFDLIRAIATDTLFAGDTQSPELFDMWFGKQDGVPVIRSIDMRSDEAPGIIPQALRHRGRFRFEHIAFATSMPGWYFEQGLYAANARNAPR
jgi:hypothetical protein